MELTTKSGTKKALDKKSSFGDVGAVYMVKNAPSTYDPGRTFSDEKLVRLKGAVFIFYWDQERWKLVPEDIVQSWPGPELFWYLYQKTGKLLHYQ